MGYVALSTIGFAMNKRLFAITVVLALSAVSALARGTGLDPARLSLPKGPASMK
jgi:hypothetical protein